ncbi:KH domain-containing protein SPIN1, partial [Zea mays]
TLIPTVPLEGKEEKKTLFLSLSQPSLSLSTRPPPCQASTARASPLQEPSPPRLGATPTLTASTWPSFSRSIRSWGPSCRCCRYAAGCSIKVRDLFFPPLACSLLLADW